VRVERDRARGEIKPRARAIRTRFVDEPLRFLLFRRQALFTAAIVVDDDRVVIRGALLAREREAGADAGRAPAVLAVIREHARVELRIARAAHRTCALGGQHFHGAEFRGGQPAVHRVVQAVERRKQMHHALADFERLVERMTQLRFVVRRHDQVGDRQLNGVFAEAVELRPRVDRHEFAVHPQMRIAARLGPLREIGVHALAVHHQRREEADVLPLMVAQQLRRDRLDALRRNRCAVVNAMLQAKLHIEQTQEVPNFGRGRDGTLATAARQALLDRDGRRNAVHGIDLGAPCRLHDGACIRIQRFEITALAFVKKNVERERRLARTGHAGDHIELAVRNVDVQRFQVVLARVDDAHHVFAFDRTPRARRAQRLLQRDALRGRVCRFRRRVHRAVVLQQRHTGMRFGTALDVLGRARAQHAAAAVAAFGTEVDDPVGRADHVEVMLDHDQRMAACEQFAERLHQLGDVVEMQARGRFVEHEKPFGDGLLRAARTARLGRFGEKAGELEPLRFAARQRRHRLTELHIFEADVDNGLQHAQHFRVVREVRGGFADGQLQHVGNAQCARRFAALDLHLEQLRAVTAPVTVRTAQVHVAQKLHFDVLETRTAASRATSVAGIEAEHARPVGALLRERRLRKQLADFVERADVAGRIRARGLADRRLVDEHHVGNLIRAGQVAECARRFGGEAEVPRHGRVQHVLQQRRLARARHARHADEPLQRNFHRNVAQIVLGRAFQHDARRARVHRALRPVRRVRDVAAPAEILAGQRARRTDQLGRAVENDRAATLARSRPHVDQPVRREHHRRVVFHHHERIARVPQTMHGLHDPAQIARMQTDTRFVQHEQRFGERRAERRGQIDPLHFAARQRAALPVKRQITEPDVAQIFQARAHFGEQQLERVVEQRARQTDFVEEAADALDRHQHQVVHGEARQRLELRAIPFDAARHEALRGRQHLVRISLAAETPQQRLRFQTRAAAGFARRVAAVLRQQHANVHLVRFRFEIFEEAFDAVPLALPLAVPVRRTVDDPVALRVRQFAPRRAAADVGLRRVAHQIVLTLLPRGRLHRLDRAVAQRFARVRDHEAEVDADHAAKAAADVARAVGRVERKQRRLRIGIAQVAFRAMQPR